MECVKIRQLLSEYVDGQAAPEERRAVEAHVAQCLVCKQELDFLQVCVKKINTLPKVSAPEDFLQKVHERIERRKAFDEAIKGFFKPSKAKTQAAVVLATVFLVIGAYRFMETELGGQKYRPAARSAKAAHVAPSISATSSEPFLMQKSLDAEKAVPSAALRDDVPRSAMKADFVASLEIRVVNMPLDEAVNRITRFAQSRGGGVVSLSPKEDGAANLVVSLPVKQYNFFLNDLTEFGDLSGGMPQPSVLSGDPVIVTVRLIKAN